MYYIYTHYHPFVTNGTYIGRTNNPANRWKYKAYSYRSNAALCLCMDTIGGWDNYCHDIINTYHTERAMKLAETYWILTKNTLYPQGCNHNLGSGLTELFGKDWKKPNTQWVLDNKEWIIELLLDEIYTEENSIFNF